MAIPARWRKIGFGHGRYWADRARSYLALLIEVVQVRRLLVLPDRHQQAIGAQEIVLLADDDMLIVGGADVLAPLVVALATIAAGDGPGSRQRVVDDGDLVAQH